MIVCPPPRWHSGIDDDASPILEGIRCALALSFPLAEEDTASALLLSALADLRSRDA